MNSYVSSIAHLFSTTPEEIVEKSEENLDEISVYYKIKRFDTKLPANLEIDGLNVRDVLTIGLFDGVDSTASEQRVFHTNSMGDWGAFSQYFNDMDKDDPVKIKIQITKNQRSGKLSVYTPNLFISHLKEYGLKDFLSLFEKISGKGPLCFEFQEGKVSLIGTLFAFVSKGHEPEYLARPTLNDDVVSQGKYMCCNDLICDYLLPTDFELKGTDYEECPILPLFQNTIILYTLCFLFDYIYLNGNKLTYKLNGYKTLSGDIQTDAFEEAGVDKKSWSKYIEIFKWLYNGGNIIDKAVIARNIISLNIADEATLSLRDGTFDSIGSNYRIYEKENVKQYLEIRNNISNQLHNYQKQIIDIYDDFENSFKKLTFTFLTFAFTTIIIRVLAKNMEDNIMLPNTIILLLLGYCAISMLYYAFARWERNRKVKLFDKQYNWTRNFYEELLSEKEMSELFTDEKKKDGTYRAFLEERSCLYDFVWVGVNAILIGILLYIKYIINSAL